LRSTVRGATPSATAISSTEYPSSRLTAIVLSVGSPSAASRRSKPSASAATASGVGSRPGRRSSPSSPARCGPAPPSARPPRFSRVSCRTSSQGNGNFGVELANRASGNTLDSDVVSGNRTSGVVITSGSSFNTVQNSKTGTDPTGLIGADFYGASLGNGGASALGNHFGVVIQNQASSNTLTNDVISGNAWDGVQFLSGASGNQVHASVIGTDAAGSFAVPNRGSGVAIARGATGNTVGGPSAADRNVISGNGYNGVYVSDGGTTGNTVQFNDIGTDVTGSRAVPNGGNGVIVQNAASYTYVYNDLVSGNSADGVLVTGGGTANNFLSGDWIGLDGTGTRALTQPGLRFSNNVGVQISNGASNTSVGGDVISGNNVGLEIDYNATSNWVVYDKIGTDVGGLHNVGNAGDGVILNGTSGNLIGYDLLAYNGDVGILGENGSNASNNSLTGDTFFVTVNGLTFGNNKGDTDFD
jgi:hypothetical protein